ncbi:MAG: Dna2/Cas4 domain-containing protein [Candidatus Promineifilaceae bacterium]|nr:Dna2/Cas4 domain-containing protein [Candidatus Promineifilaceae bacterium]
MEGFALGWSALGVALLLLALALAIKASEWWSQARLPAGSVIYTDTGTWYRQQEALYAPTLQLVGKPDYLVEEADGTIIPVEIKSSAAPDSPYPGHVLQLAAYCLLVDEAYGLRPDYGIIQYRDHAFAVSFTDEMEADILDLLAEMRADRFARDVDRDHDNWRKCRGCGFNEICAQSLV